MLFVSILHRCLVASGQDREVMQKSYLKRAITSYFQQKANTIIATNTQQLQTNKADGNCLFIHLKYHSDYTPANEFNSLTNSSMVKSFNEKLGLKDQQ